MANNPKEGDPSSRSAGAFRDFFPTPLTSQQVFSFILRCPNNPQLSHKDHFEVVLKFPEPYPWQTTKCYGNVRHWLHVEIRLATPCLSLAFWSLCHSKLSRPLMVCWDWNRKEQPRATDVLHCQIIIFGYKLDGCCKEATIRSVLSSTSLGLRLQPKIVAFCSLKKGTLWTPPQGGPQLYFGDTPK